MTKNRFRVQGSRFRAGFPVQASFAKATAAKGSRFAHRLAALTIVTALLGATTALSQASSPKPQAGVAPPQASSPKPQAGVAPPQASSPKPQAGVAPPQAGVAPPQASSPKPQAVQDPPQFRGGVTLVPLDVRVVDKNGKPVPDLKASDFTILENKVPQKIEQFSTQRFEAEPPKAGEERRPPRASSGFDLSSPNRRTFLILLGRGYLQEPSKGIDAMLHLVRERLLPQDYVAVMAWNRATDFTTDHELVAGVLERFRPENVHIEHELVLWEGSLSRLYGDGRIPGYLQKMMDDVFGGAMAASLRKLDVPRAELVESNSHVLETQRQILREPKQLSTEERKFLKVTAGVDEMDEIIDMRGGLSRLSRQISDLNSIPVAIELLRDLAGQKQLMYLSEYGLGPVSFDWEEVIGQRASDARVTLNVIHSGGLRSGGGGAIWAGQVARGITERTGGQFFAHRFYNSAQDVDLMDQATRFQYTLAYSPTTAPTDRAYRKIEIKLNRPGLTVLTRDGYFARADITAAERKEALVFGRVASMAELRFPIPDLGLTNLGAEPAKSGTKDVPVSMTIDLNRVYFHKEGGRNVGSLEVAVFAVTDRGKPAGRNWNTLELSFTDARLDELKRTGLRHTVLVPTTTKPADVKIVVYDYESDLAGSTVVKVERK